MPKNICASRRFGLSSEENKHGCNWSQTERRPEWTVADVKPVLSRCGWWKAPHIRSRMVTRGQFECAPWGRAARRAKAVKTNWVNRRWQTTWPNNLPIPWVGILSIFQCCPGKFRSQLKTLCQSFHAFLFSISTACSLLGAAIYHLFLPFVIMLKKVCLHRNPFKVR